MNFFKKLFSAKKEVHEVKDESTRLAEMIQTIENVLEEENKPEILIQVKSTITEYEDVNSNNAFIRSGITDKVLQEKILKYYTWQSCGDFDNNFQCTMQLILTEALDKYKPEVDSETKLDNFFEFLNNDAESDENETK